ncbi:flagellar protein FliT [Variovorax paradoxus]|nr:flagellar protein FliT [Variovorax paradoxus]
MAAHSEIVHCYVQLASTTSSMAALARAKEWDRLPALEEQCATVVERLKQIGPTEPLDPAQLDQAQRLMERIRADQDEVRRLVKPQLERLVATMARLQRQGELDKAYGLSR